VTLATPYSGILSIPRDLLHTLLVLGHGHRLTIDPAAHHLGDELSIKAPLLDPPQPEGDSLERTIELAEVPPDPAFLVLDVLAVVSETADPDYSKRVSDGELRTYVSLNGRRIDYLNRHIKTRNESTERIAIAIPNGLLHPGKNTLRFELTTTADNLVDDLGVLQIALEFRSSRPVLAQPGPQGAP
jgi:hypothetical protein